MKSPITHHPSPENTQPPNSNMECGGLTPIWISRTDITQVGNLLYRRLTVGTLGIYPLVIGAYLVLGAWLLEIF